MNSQKYTLDAVKNHLRITQNFENDLLRLYMGAALSIASDFIGAEIIGESETASESQINLTDAILSALLLIIGDLYKTRGNVEQSEHVRMTGPAAHILWHYRRNFGV